MFLLGGFMEAADPAVAAYIARWRPSSVSPQAAAFARQVVPLAAPAGQERAKNLLWAAGKLADYAIGLGLEPVPEVVLHPSAAERFTRCAPGLTAVARRTLRTNLRFIGRRVVPQMYPADRLTTGHHTGHDIAILVIGLAAAVLVAAIAVRRHRRRRTQRLDPLAHEASEDPC